MKPSPTPTKAEEMAQWLRSKPDVEKALETLKEMRSDIKHSLEVDDNCPALVHDLLAIDTITTELERLAQVEAAAGELRDFIKDCVEDDLDRISPGLKARAKKLHQAAQPTPGKAGA